MLGKRHWRDDHGHLPLRGPTSHPFRGDCLRVPQPEMRDQSALRIIGIMQARYLKVHPVAGVAALAILVGGFKLIAGGPLACTWACTHLPQQLCAVSLASRDDDKEEK